MERFDLSSLDGREALIERIFTYPATPHNRKHGPYGYKNYDGYREWVRDEFSYQCVFSLLREKWSPSSSSFHIDHLAPQSQQPQLACNYENLIYLESSLNLRKNNNSLPDPCQIALGDHLFIHVQGDRAGEIEAKNDSPQGHEIIRILKLDNELITNARRTWLRILRNTAQSDEALFKDLVSYPANLTDLSKLKPVGNNKPEGLHLSAHFLRGNSTLPEYV